MSDKKTLKKEGYKEFLKALKVPQFAELVNKFSSKEVVVISLSFGYIDGKCFSEKSISNFLDISEKEIKKILKNFLETYSHSSQKILDNDINITSEHKKTLRYPKQK